MNNEILPNPTVVAQWTEAGAILMDVATGDCFELNTLGADVWRHIAQCESVEKIVSTLATSTGEPPSRIDGDVRSLIATLQKHGLVKLSK